MGFNWRLHYGRCFSRLFNVGFYREDRLEMNVPYNTGKVKIGCNYQKPRFVENDPDMLQLQAWLIDDPARLRKQYWARKIYVFTLIFVFLVIWLRT